MLDVEFVKGLDLSKIYLVGLNTDKISEYDMEGLNKLFHDAGLRVIFVMVSDSSDLKIFEPIGIDKEKLKELLR